MAFVTGITNMSFERESVSSCGNNKFGTNSFQSFSRNFKSVSVTGFKTLHTAFSCSKKSSMLYLFQRVIEVGARLIQIEQVLQIGAKLLQIGAVPIVTNRGNSYTKSGQVLQIGAIITNRCGTFCLPIIDNILVVCSALANLKRSFV